jgi:hypothetical protein
MSTEELKKKNMKYMIKNKQEYLNDFYNAIDDDNEYLRVSNLFISSLKSNKLFKNYFKIYNFESMSH